MKTDLFQSCGYCWVFKICWDTECSTFTASSFNINKRWQKYTAELYKKIFMAQITTWCDHSPRARHPGMWSQVGLRKHRCEQSRWRWWNSIWVILNPKRWCCIIAALYKPANWNTQQWPQDWKMSVFIPIPKKGNAKECSNYHTIALFSHGTNVHIHE